MSVISSYPIYDLSNPHFRDVEILTKENKTLKGQFVKFKVAKDSFGYIYPAEKYCFLPHENRESFWKSFQANGGEFKEFPKYIKQLGLNEMIKITISPLLVT